MIPENDKDIISVYPNPTEEKLNIVVHDNIDNTEIILLDHLGKFLEKVRVNSMQSGQKLTFDVSNLSNGLYFVHFINNNTSLKESFTVTK